MSNGKIVILISSLLWFSMSFAQQPDTTFLFRNDKNGVYHAVFVDTTGTADAYSWIAQSMRIDTLMYEEAIAREKKEIGVVKKNQIPLAESWFSLHQFKGKFYVYSPSEPYYNLYVKFTDSTMIINYFDDGLRPSLITSVSKIQKNKLEIRSQGDLSSMNRMIIHFLTTERDVAIFEFPDSQLENKYALMVAENSLRKFPIIVNYCETDRVGKWNFEEIDFQKLLRTKL